MLDSVFCRTDSTLSPLIAVLTCKIEELGSELKEHYKIEAFTPLLEPAQVRAT